MRKAKDHLLIEKHNNRMKKIMPEEKRLIFYGTILGQSLVMGEYILSLIPEEKFSSLPRKLHYALASTYHNYLAIVREEKDEMSYDPNFQENFDSSPLDERFAHVVKQLYDMCKKEKLL